MRSLNVRVYVAVKILLVCPFQSPDFLQVVVCDGLVTGDGDHRVHRSSFFFHFLTRKGEKQDMFAILLAWFYCGLHWLHMASAILVMKVCMMTIPLRGISVESIRGYKVKPGLLPLLVGNCTGIAAYEKSPLRFWA